MQALLKEFEESVDHTNLLDVVYAVTKLYTTFQEKIARADEEAKEEYTLYLFYTAFDLLLGCIAFEGGNKS